MVLRELSAALDALDTSFKRDETGAEAKTALAIGLRAFTAAVQHQPATAAQGGKPSGSPSPAQAQAELAKSSAKGQETIAEAAPAPAPSPSPSDPPPAAAADTWTASTASTGDGYRCPQCGKAYSEPTTCTNQHPPAEVVPVAELAGGGSAAPAQGDASAAAQGDASAAAQADGSAEPDWPADQA